MSPVYIAAFSSNWRTPCLLPARALLLSQGQTYSCFMCRCMLVHRWKHANACMLNAFATRDSASSLFHHVEVLVQFYLLGLLLDVVCVDCILLLGSMLTLQMTPFMWIYIQLPVSQNVCSILWRPYTVLREHQEQDWVGKKRDIELLLIQQP